MDGSTVSIKRLVFPASAGLPRVGITTAADFWKGEPRRAIFWYDDSLPKVLELNTRDLHPIRSRPYWAYLCTKGSVHRELTLSSHVVLGDVGRSSYRKELACKLYELD
jgi:hypothetical protein